jgi:hypothetical protein
MNLLGGIRNLLATGERRLARLDRQRRRHRVAGWGNSLLQPAIGKVNQFLAGAKPRMQQMLEQANQQIQQLPAQPRARHQPDLDPRARRRQGPGDHRAEAGSSSRSTSELMAKADGWRVTRATLGLPASVPIPFVDGRIDSAINAASTRRSTPSRPR